MAAVMPYLESSVSIGGGNVYAATGESAGEMSYLVAELSPHHQLAWLAQVARVSGLYSHTRSSHRSWRRHCHSRRRFVVS
jgi:hypothetical protein